MDADVRVISALYSVSAITAAPTLEPDGSHNISHGSHVSHGKASQDDDVLRRHVDGWRRGREGGK